VGYIPTVEGKDFGLWSEYEELNKGWIVDAFKVNPSGDMGALDEIASEKDVLVIPDIWDLILLDANGNEINYDASSCGDQGRVEPAAEEQVAENPEDGPASPVWLLSPPPNPLRPNLVNYNMRSDPIFLEAVETIHKYRATTFHDICTATKVREEPRRAIKITISWVLTTDSHNMLLQFQNSNRFNHQFFAFSEKQVDTMVVTPVFGGFEDGAEIVGHYVAIVPWEVYFKDELPNGTDAVEAVVDSSCGHTFTFDIHGHNATFKGEVDGHDYAYDHMGKASHFGDIAHDSCVYTLTVYPTAAYEESYESNNPLYYMLFIFGIFGLTSMAFLLFDCLVRKRQKALVHTTKRQNALVSSLFPKSVQKQLLEDLEEGKWNKSGTAGLRSFLRETDVTTELKMGKSIPFTENGKSKPIADLFPDVTIMFADIAGFTGEHSHGVTCRISKCLSPFPFPRPAFALTITSSNSDFAMMKNPIHQKAWSSTREPSQVFTLLENIYHEFDQLCKRRRVFKVEVVGDCYVAYVEGLMRGASTISIARFDPTHLTSASSSFLSCSPASAASQILARSTPLLWRGSPGTVWKA
jgi:Adenylate and Guanylate cyclase catalytic domain